MSELSEKDDEPSSSLTRQTFILESFRAVLAGIQETCFSTFAIFIAVAHFGFSEFPKGILTSCQALGLIGSLFVIPLIARRGFTVSRGAAGIHLLSMLGFGAAAMFPNNPWIFLSGMSLGMGIVAMAVPLQTQYLRTNFPSRGRGRLFSVSIFIRAISAMLFSYLIGRYLDADLSRFPQVLGFFAFGSGAIALCQWLIPSKSLGEDSKKAPLRQSTTILKED
ncbi:MAG: hypothetical protein AAF226_19185, partial [Verrucomicrobiota bacterium]